MAGATFSVDDRRERRKLGDVGRNLLAEAERVLGQHSPNDFDTTVDAAPESIEAVRAVEDEEGWRAGYQSLEDFYEAHETRHPDIRFYGHVRRDIAVPAPLSSPGGTIAERIARLRDRAKTGEARFRGLSSSGDGI